MWTFDLKTEQWLEIRLDFPLKWKEYRFGVDLDGILNIIKYRDESATNNAQLTRIALK